MKTKWKHTRALRSVLAEYITWKLGFSHTEEEINFLLTDPDVVTPLMVANRWGSNTSQHNRITTALQEIQAITEEEPK